MNQNGKNLLAILFQEVSAQDLSTLPIEQLRHLQRVLKEAENIAVANEMFSLDQEHVTVDLVNEFLKANAGKVLSPLVMDNVSNAISNLKKQKQKKLFILSDDEKRECSFTSTNRKDRNTHIFLIREVGGDRITLWRKPPLPFGLWME